MASWHGPSSLELTAMDAHGSCDFDTHTGRFLLTLLFEEKVGAAMRDESMSNAWCFLRSLFNKDFRAAGQVADPARGPLTACEPCPTSAPAVRVRVSEPATKTATPAQGPRKRGSRYTAADLEEMRLSNPRKLARILSNRRSLERSLAKRKNKKKSPPRFEW